MSKSAAILLTAIITMVLTSLLWLGIGALVYKTWISEDSWVGGDPFVVELEAPITVNVGEEWTLNVTATNPGDEVATLGSIDIYDSLLDGFEVLRVTPTPESNDAIFDFQSFYLDGIRIAPGESASVSFKLKAIKPGRWQGDVDCCTPMESFSTAVAVVEVMEAEAQ